MKHQLSITWAEGINNKGNQLRSQISSVLAEADLGENRDHNCPKIIAGKLIGVGLDQLLHLASAKDVEAGFRHRRYRLAEIDRDGVFILHLID